MGSLTILFFTICNFFIDKSLGATPVKPPILGDRLIVEINNKSYTQRQVEVYMTIKETIKTSGYKNIKLIEKNTWNDFLEEFVFDMLIDQKARILNSFNPTNIMIQKTIKIFETKKAKNKNLLKKITALSINKLTLLHVIPSVLRVETFRRNKAKKAGFKFKMSIKPEWIINLRNKAIIRYYKGAKIYKQIHPGYLNGKKDNSL